ncbi:MAG: NUDIX domain-containing protein [Streptococcaceae bacterium]|nr:NUDIX domain-containing protein [Streptococcaceae bacterium]
MADYIKWIRSKVAHEQIFLNYCVALIRNSEGKILMQRRGDNHLWSFVGGCMELGEDFETALRREIFEETGTTAVKIVRQLGVYTWKDVLYPNGDKVQSIDIVYICELTAPLDISYTDEETLELRWVDLKTLSLPLFISGHKQVIRDYLAQEEGYVY